MIRPKDVPRGRVWHEKNYQQAGAAGRLHELDLVRKDQFPSKTYWEACALTVLLGICWHTQTHEGKLSRFCFQEIARTHLPQSLTREDIDGARPEPGSLEASSQYSMA